MLLMQLDVELLLHWPIGLYYMNDLKCLEN